MVLSMYCSISEPPFDYWTLSETDSIRYGVVSELVDHMRWCGLNTSTKIALPQCGQVSYFCPDYVRKYF